MNVSPEVRIWASKADRDLEAARRLARGDPPLPDQVGFFCQQTAEKYLKAFLIAVEQVPPRTHDVDALVEMCAAVDPAFERLQSVVEGLTEFAVIFRYPEAWSDQVSADRSMDQAEQVRALVRQKPSLTD